MDGKNNYNKEIDQELYERVRRHNKEQARARSVGREKKALSKAQKANRRVAIALCIALFLGSAIGVGGTLGIQSLYSGSGFEYRAEMNKINEREIERIVALMEANGLNTTPIEKSTWRNPAEYANDYTVLEGQISDNDVYAFYQLFRTAGSTTDIYETAKVLKVLGYRGSDHSAVWEQFLIHTRVAGEVGFYDYYYNSDGTFQRRAASRAVWCQYAERMIRDKYAIIDAVGDNFNVDGEEVADSVIESGRRPK